MQNITAEWQDAMSDQKRNAILQLIFANTEGDDEREKWLEHLESASDEQDADEMVAILSKVSS